mmetsp:Transcript_47366/g.144084  ORF Transcript_47366/g.144084 Transcript_47366/m.144084 type:complete len:202 (-) Transcript_47366:11-616(-)
MRRSSSCGHRRAEACSPSGPSSTCQSPCLLWISPQARRWRRLGGPMGRSACWTSREWRALARLGIAMRCAWSWHSSACHGAVVTLVGEVFPALEQARSLGDAWQEEQCGRVSAPAAGNPGHRGPASVSLQRSIATSGGPHRQLPPRRESPLAPFQSQRAQNSGPLIRSRRSAAWRGDRLALIRRFGCHRRRRVPPRICWPR